MDGWKGAGGATGGGRLREGGDGDAEAAMGRWDRGVAPIQIGEGREGGVGRVGGSGEQWGLGFRSVDRGG